MAVNVALAEPAPRKPTNETALKQYTRAARLFGNRDYAEAIKEFKASYLSEPAPATEFNLGVCYRLLGERATDPAAKREQFDAAIWHYKRFQKASPETPELASQVQKLIDDMRTKMEALPTPMPVITAPTPRAQSPSVETAAEIEAEPFYRDPIAWALTGAGVASLAVAGGFFWNASSLRQDAAATPDQQDQNELRETAHTRSLIGATLTVVGGGLLVSGVIKLIVHDSEPRMRTHAVSLGVTGHGLFVLGQF